jgi:hypothetical protein
MKATKKKAHTVNEEQASPAGIALRPIVADDYPEEVVDNGKVYYRFYVRPRLIVYEVVLWHSRVVDGYYIVPVNLKFSTFAAMEKYMDANESNYSLKVIAK